MENCQQRFLDVLVKRKGDNNMSHNVLSGINTPRQLSAYFPPSTPPSSEFEPCRRQCWSCTKEKTTVSGGVRLSASYTAVTIGEHNSGQAVGRHSRSRGPEGSRYSVKQRRNAWVGVTGGPRENPPFSGIVRHDSHMRKSGGDPAGNWNPARLGGRQGPMSRCYAMLGAQCNDPPLLLSVLADQNILKVSVCRHIPIDFNIGRVAPYLRRHLQFLYTGLNEAGGPGTRVELTDAAAFNAGKQEHFTSIFLFYSRYQPDIDTIDPFLTDVKCLARHCEFKYGDELVSDKIFLGEPGSFPGRADPGFPQVGIVPYNAAGRWVFSVISRSRPPLYSDNAPYSPPFNLIGSQDLDVKSHSNLFTHSELSTEQCRNERAEETGDPRENPATNGTVRHDYLLRKSGVNRPGIEPGSPRWEGSSLTAQPPWPELISFRNHNLLEIFQRFSVRVPLQVDRISSRHDRPLPGRPVPISSAMLDVDFLTLINDLDTSFCDLE
ncbi:hypothetical protein PR048_013619 [Dryococelus australis]|uniref:Uncharacterized protein n=1 Tax=Dryococelus australis TaxID=614101 RepID=A0ABQ9HSP8_9NEOP|nr:hypothetical protein PR048_013619 [Dryococelus australis]